MPTSAVWAFYGQVAVLGSRNTEKDLHKPVWTATEGAKGYLDYFKFYP